MENLNRIKQIEDNKDFVRMLYNLGYVQPKIFRDIELMKDYKYLIEDDIKPHEAYKIIGSKYKITANHVRFLVKRLILEL